MTIGLRVSCLLEADIKQKQTVKTTHMTVYTKLRQVEKINCPVPSSSSFCSRNVLPSISGAQQRFPACKGQLVFAA